MSTPDFDHNLEAEKLAVELAKLKADRKRIDAETAKLRAETRKAYAEANKLRAENGQRLDAEIAKLMAETALLNTGRWWHPMAIGAAFATAIMAATFTLTKMLT